MQINAGGCESPTANDFHQTNFPLNLLTPGEDRFASLGVIMRKFAVLLAATLMVSVPLTMTVTTDVYAAAKKGKKHRHHRAAPKAAPAETGVQPPFHAMWRAVDDLGRTLLAGGKR
jgi:hypothetical protein